MTNNNNKLSMASAYDPATVEQRIYDNWNSTGKFQPTIDKGKDPFVMIMPPPNVTGELHMGHALTFAVEDMIVRWHRMKGEPTLFLPGTDHAGIATQVVVERLLASEGTNRHDLGREAFEERIWSWVEEYGERIYDQLRRLGTSCDWSRKTFTLDDGPRKAVRKTFVDLYRRGLIYRGERITNWCPRCSTALSDLEVKYKEVVGSLYEIKYPLTEDGDYVVVATTRPETMLGDTGVAVNPNDKRYQSLIGSFVSLPLSDRLIPIVGDEAVEIEFGSGALKVTPGHDHVDFEIGQRHHLPIVNVISEDGRMNAGAGRFSGMDTSSCREAIIEDLQSRGLLSNVRDFTHSVGHCDRCDEVIEPLVTKQWYISVEPLAKPARDAVRNGDIKIIPERFSNVYFNWMDNIRDWPVSRQLWWGHQIPVWYCEDCDEEIVDYTDPTSCRKCGSSKISRDQDVLDTWFSSGLWTHSTLGWPEENEDLNYFYPGSVMETGYDILFFWVARMIMLGIENMGEVPFRTVYLHGLVLDPEGVKMSKTKGNVLDPLALIDEYGADAVRFALTTGTAAGNNVRMSEGRLESSRNFANKLWNSARFVLAAIEREGLTESWVEAKPVHLHDRWIVSKLNKLQLNVDRHMNEYQFGDAQREIHDFLWSQYCDWYIEMSKIRMQADSPDSPVSTLVYVLEKTLRLLHPFMPFVTEEIWGKLCRSVSIPAKWPEALIVAEYPVCNRELLNQDAENDMEIMFELIGSVRNIKAELRIPPNVKLPADLASSEYRELLEFHKKDLYVLAGIDTDKRNNISRDSTSSSVTLVTNGITASLDIGNYADAKIELDRLVKERDEVLKYTQTIERRLANSGFTANAPEEVIEKEKERLQGAVNRKERLEEILRSLRK